MTILACILLPLGALALKRWLFAPGGELDRYNERVSPHWIATHTREDGKS